MHIQYVQIHISCTIPCESHSPPSHILFCYILSNFAAFAYYIIHLSSLSSHKLHLLFCCVLHILVSTKLFFFLALFWAVIRIDSVFFLKLPLHSHFQDSSNENSSVWRLKYTYIRFSYYICLLIVLLLIITVSLSFLVALISFSMLFIMSSSSSWIHLSTLSSILASPLPTFLNTCSLYMSYLRCKAICIISSFLVLWSICCSSLVHFKIGTELLTQRTAQVFIPLMRFLLCCLVLSSLLVLLKYSF